MHKRRALIVLLAAMLTVAGMALPSHTAKAAIAANAEVFIDSLVAAALKTITAGDSQNDKEKTFRALLDANFDMPRISRFVLGRYWSTASDADKQQYLPLFETYVVRAYANRFTQYTGETRWSRARSSSRTARRRSESIGSCTRTATTIESPT